MVHIGESPLKTLTSSCVWPDNINTYDPYHEDNLNPMDDRDWVMMPSSPASSTRSEPPPIAHNTHSAPAKMKLSKIPEDGSVLEEELESQQYELPILEEECEVLRTRHERIAVRRADIEGVLEKYEEKLADVVFQESADEARYEASLERLESARKRTRELVNRVTRKLEKKRKKTLVEFEAMFLRGESSKTLLHLRIEAL